MPDLTSGWGRSNLDLTGRTPDFAPADLTKVGPKGYIHGWIFVGPQAIGARVFHPGRGHGTVRRAGRGKTTVHYDSGHKETYDSKPPKHFEKRPAGKPAQGKPAAAAAPAKAPAKAPAPAAPAKAPEAPKPAKVPAGEKPMTMDQHLDWAKRDIKNNRADRAVMHLTSAADKAPDKKSRAAIIAQRDRLAARLMGKPEPGAPKPAKKPAKAPDAGKPEAPKVDRAAIVGDLREHAPKVDKKAWEKAGEREVSDRVTGIGSRIGDWYSPGGKQAKEFDNERRTAAKELGEAKAERADTAATRDYLRGVAANDKQDADRRAVAGELADKFDAKLATLDEKIKTREAQLDAAAPDGKLLGKADYEFQGSGPEKVTFELDRRQAVDAAKKRIREEVAGQMPPGEHTPNSPSGRHESRLVFHEEKALANDMGARDYDNRADKLDALAAQAKDPRAKAAIKANADKAREYAKDYRETAEADRIRAKREREAFAQEMKSRAGEIGEKKRRAYQLAVAQAALRGGRPLEGSRRDTARNIFRATAADGIRAAATKGGAPDDFKGSPEVAGWQEKNGEYLKAIGDLYATRAQHDAARSRLTALEAAAPGDGAAPEHHAAYKEMHSQLTAEVDSTRKALPGLAADANAKHEAAQAATDKLRASAGLKPSKIPGPESGRLHSAYRRELKDNGTKSEPTLGALGSKPKATKPAAAEAEASSVLGPLPKPTPTQTHLANPNLSHHDRAILQGAEKTAAGKDSDPVVREAELAARHAKVEQDARAEAVAMVPEGMRGSFDPGDHPAKIIEADKRIATLSSEAKELNRRAAALYQASKKTHDLKVQATLRGMHSKAQREADEAERRVKQAMSAAFQTRGRFEHAIEAESSKITKPHIEAARTALAENRTLDALDALAAADNSTMHPKTKEAIEALRKKVHQRVDYNMQVQAARTAAAKNPNLAPQNAPSAPEASPAPEVKPDVKPTLSPAQQRAKQLAEFSPKALNSLLGDGPGAVTHKPSRKVVEAMRDAGWTLTDLQPGMSSWKGPDGKRMSLFSATAASPNPSFHDGNKTLSYKKALELASGSK
jgi:hypothetical protein